MALRGRVHPGLCFGFALGALVSTPGAPAVQKPNGNSISGDDEA